MANVYDLIDNMFDNAELSAESFDPTISEEAIPFNTDFERKVKSIDIFDDIWLGIGLTTQDLDKMKKSLLDNPERGELAKYNIKDFAGCDLWKLRFGTKVGECRLVYAYYPHINIIYLIYVYKKVDAPDKQHGDLTLKHWDNLSKDSKELKRSLENSIEYQGWRSFYDRKKKNR